VGRTAGFSCGGVALSLGLCEGFANTTGWEMLEQTFLDRTLLVWMQ